VPWAGAIPRQGGALMRWLVGIAALALVVYLFVSIFKPEKY
jgi:K+-transporting ATPase KdpF subunit